jgi:hypothetical protein
VSLITVAAIGALKTMRRTQIKADLNELANGMDELKNKTTAYPPNCQTDGTAGPLVEAEVVNNLRRYFKQMAPKSQEPDSLVLVLCGQKVSDPNFRKLHSGGITGPEALVFWLGGFSSDPKFPISGEGGPSYRIPSLGDPNNRKLDPIESRTKTYPFDVTRLGPRASDGYFDESTAKGARFFEYTVVVNGQTQFRRINFWYYTPAKNEQPYVYFDTSRHPVGTVSGSNLLGSYDPPAATVDVGNSSLNSVYAFKKVAETPVTGAPQIQFINPDKFQIFHCGIDGEWDTAAFKRMSVKEVNANVAANYLLFPSGPFVGEMADTEVNFATETTIEDSVK